MKKHLLFCLLIFAWVLPINAALQDELYAAALNSDLVKDVKPDGEVLSQSFTKKNSESFEVILNYSDSTLLLQHLVLVDIKVVVTQLPDYGSETTYQVIRARKVLDIQ